MAALCCIALFQVPAGAESIVIGQEDLDGHKYMHAPSIRVEVVRGSPRPSITTKAETRLEFGDGTTTIVPPDSRLQISVSDSTEPVWRYSVGVRSIPYAQRLDAAKVRRQWEAKGYSAWTREVGRVYRNQAGTILADTRKVWVLLGQALTEDAAKQLDRRLLKQGTSSWVHRELAKPAEGIVHVRKRGGASIAKGATPLRMVSAEPLTVDSVEFGIGFWGRGYKEHRSYPGILEFRAVAGGNMQIINEVPMEAYIRGVVPAEISVKAPPHAMRAQAVAARTEALAKLGTRHIGSPFDFSASQHDQEYAGVTRATPATNAAVSATAGIAVMRDGRFIDAVYSANCGGHTEHNNNVWSSNPDEVLRGILDGPTQGVPFGSPLRTRELRRWLTTRPLTYCGDPRVGEKDKYRWTVHMSPSEIRKEVNHHYRVGDIRDIRERERGVSGRLKRVDIIGTTDNVAVRKELNIRKVFGGLKSALFIVDIARDRHGHPERFTFRGGGWGHGVGLCQNGAMGMAYDGYEYPAILAHYFQQTHLRRMYED